MLWGHFDKKLTINVAAFDLPVTRCNFERAKQEKLLLNDNGNIKDALSTISK